MFLISVGSAIVGLVADAGISSLIGNVAATCTTKSGCKVFDKVMIGVGTAVVAGMAGEAAMNYIDRKAQRLEDYISSSKEAIDSMTEAKKEAENGGEISE